MVSLVMVPVVLGLLVGAWVWCRPHKTMDSSFQQGTEQTGGSSVMMLGVFMCMDWVHLPD